MTAATSVPAPAPWRRRGRAAPRTRCRGRVAPWLVVLLPAAFAAAPRAARAQLIEQYYPSGIPGYESWFSDAVLDRPRTEYDALGVRAGSFVIRPSFSESLGYDSNIYGASHPVGSALAETQAAVAASSDWSRDALDASVSVDQTQYLRHASASYTDWTAGLGGVLDIGRDRLTLAFAHLTATTVAGQIGTLSVGQPVTITFDSARASYEATFGRFTLEPALETDIFRFSNGPVGGGSEAGNNYNSFSASLTGGYALAPGRNLVLVARGINADYPTRTPGVATPDYDDVSLVGGIDYRSGELFRYRATLGYEQRSYVNTTLSGSSAPLAELDVIWTPTRLTTVTGQVSRSLQNAISTVASNNYTYTTTRLVVDHEYFRNVLLQGYGAFQNADYQTHGETQRVVSAGASVTWLLNREMSVIGRVNWSLSTDNVDTALNQTIGLAELTLAVHL